MITTVGLLILGSVALALWAFAALRHFLKKIFIEKRQITAWVCLGFVVLLQIWFVTIFHPAVGFDVGAIHQGLIDPDQAELRAYFSIYPNNLWLLLVQNFLAERSGTTAWLFFDYVTLFLVDLSMVFNLFTVKVLAPRQVPTAVYCHALWLGCFPWIVVPYSDTWVLPLVSGYLLTYVIWRHSQLPNLVKIIAAGCSGILVVNAYFLKPSALIPVVAILIGELVQLARRFSTKSDQSLLGQKFWSHCLIILALWSGFAGSYFTIQRTLQQQTYLTLQPGREMTAWNYFSMGLSGVGGYNGQDVLALNRLPSKKARTAYSQKLIRQRLKKHGFIGYLRFLFNKQRANTADGTFAWVKEGHFFAEEGVPEQKGAIGQLRNLFYLNGRYLGDFRFWAQLIWISGLTVIFLGWRRRDLITQILRLTFIGGCLFLLIFEGGRSRYLIQFLPIFLLLIPLLGPTALAQWQRLFSWQKIDFSEPTPLVISPKKESTQPAGTMMEK